MATTKRMRRHARQSMTVEPGSIRWQMLLYGTVFWQDGPRFESEKKACLAWREHRDELMRHCHPGQRPHGFFKFELGIEKPMHPWHWQLSVLLDRGLVDAAEASALEHMHEALAPGDHHYGAAWEMPGLPPPVMPTQRRVAELETIARWHEFRGRAAEAETYRRRAEAARRLLGELCNPK